MGSMKIGDPCPRCGKPLSRATAQFFWRGSHYDGAVCNDHKPALLYSIEGEEMPPLQGSVTPKSGVLRICFSERDDGGLRIWSDDLPGLVLSGSDQSAVWRDLGGAIEVLIRHNGFNASATADSPSEAQGVNHD